MESDGACPGHICVNALDASQMMRVRLGYDVIYRGYSNICHKYEFSSSEVENIYFMSGETTNEIYNFFTSRDEIKLIYILITKKKKKKNLFIIYNV